MNRAAAFFVRMSSVLLAGFVLSSGPAPAQQKSLKEQLVGAWILVSNQNIAANGEKRQLFGASPKGISIFDASGWYTQIQVNPNRPEFKGPTRLDGTAEENRAVVRATAGHFGTWSVNEADKTLALVANSFPNDDGLVSSERSP